MSECKICYINGEYIHNDANYPISKCTCECHKSKTELGAAGGKATAHTKPESPTVSEEIEKILDKFYESALHETEENGTLHISLINATQAIEELIERVVKERCNEVQE